MARNKQKPLPEPKVLDPLPLNTQPVLRRGAEAVAYHIPTAPPGPDQPVLKTTITLPHRSRWTSGLHFHTTYTEYLHLIKGCIFVELDGSLKILSTKAGGEFSVDTGEVMKEGLEITVPKYARHNWGRAERHLGFRGMPHRKLVYPEDLDDEVIVEEWTDPADISKPLFFWNLNGVITSEQDTPLSARQSLTEVAFGSWWLPFQLFIIFWDLDNWPVFSILRDWFGICLRGSVGHRLESLVEYFVTFVVLFAAKSLGRILGIRAVARDRTPVNLWEAYKRSGG